MTSEPERSENRAPIRLQQRAEEGRSGPRLVLAALATALAASAVAGLQHGCSRHAPGREAVSRGACATCHMAEYEATRSPPHEGLFGTTCGDCHDEDDWAPAHGTVTHDWFPLTDGHAAVQCASCHTQGYTPGATSSQCVSCHRDDYDASPYPGHNVFPLTCTDCHTTARWRPSSFAHEWPLEGSHVGTPCASCHVGDPPVYDGTPTECVECHRGDYERSPFPGHSAFPTTCADCHTTASWRGPSFTHPWSLEGAHGTTPCASCHVGDPPIYAGTPRECSSCHMPDYDRSTFPGHNVFPTTCADCHGTTTWIPSRFMHDWPLTGAHVGTRCTSCHTGTPPRYDGTPTECVDCHRADYDASPLPGHSSFATTCADCHTTDTFRTGTFAHAWPLTGAHDATPCASCHTGTPPRYAGTPTDCVSCHRDDYDRSTQPGHDRYPTTCLDCHTTTAWRPSSFEHPWPLAGAHGRTGCANCHGDPPTHAGTTRECVGCHRADYDASPYPGHDHFPTTCADCHGNESFRPATFVHSFPLTGGHGSVACATCHGTPPVYGGTPSTCVSCHRDDFDRAGTLVSGHTSYSTTCTDCHSITAWRPSSFTHPWPLVGAHETAVCSGCHTGTPPRYAGTSTDCIDCHADDRARSTFPGHSTFPTTCADCHNTYAWPGARFDHPWPLAGAHTSAPCTSCHTGTPPRYAGTSRDCVSCHRDDYDRSTYPPHATFATTCADCHASTGWSPAYRGYHPQAIFDITSGDHRRPCLSCHQPALGPWWGGANTACTSCHDRAREDAEHRGRSGYPTGAAPANFCLDCHPHGD